MVWSTARTSDQAISLDEYQGFGAEVIEPINNHRLKQLVEGPVRLIIEVTAVSWKMFKGRKKWPYSNLKSPLNKIVFANFFVRGDGDLQNCKCIGCIQLWGAINALPNAIRS